MPSYAITAPRGRLSSSQKQVMAAEITRVHCAVTGATTSFVQVVFHDIPDGDYFRGGRQLQGLDNVHVHGWIRAGRDAATKERLLLDLLHVVSESAALPSHRIQIFLMDVPARQIVEFGQIAPLPGEEAAWWDAMPSDVRAEIESQGT